MALVRIGLLAGICAMVACGTTVIEVSVTARSSVETAASLRLIATNDGDRVEQSFDVSGRTFPLSFTITPDDRDGELELTLEASDAGGALVGVVNSRVEISGGGSVKLDLQLEPADFPVNTDVDGVQRPAFRLGRNGRAMVATPDGGFATTFVNDCQVATTCDVFVRRFDSDGKPVQMRNSTAEFSINSDDYPVVSVPAIGGTINGEIAVVWETPAAIHVSQINADGQAIVTDAQVTEITVENPVDPAILGRADDFIITWAQEADNPNPAGLFQRVLTGGVLAPTTLSRDASAASTPTLAQATGVNVLTAWAEGGSAFIEVTTAGGLGSEDEVVSLDNEQIGALQVVKTDTGFALSYGRSAGGVARGLTLTELSTGGTFVRDVELEATPRSPVDRPAIAASTDAGVAVVWTDCGGDDCDIFMQQLRADLSAASEVIRVNTTTAGDQFDPAIVAVDGGFAVMWADGSRIEPDTEGGIRARVLYTDSDAD